MKTPAGYSLDDFATILERIYEGTGTTNQVELAKVLGIRQSSISDAKRRGKIPAEWLDTLARRKNLSQEWILTGAWPKYVVTLDDEAHPGSVVVMERRSLEDYSIEELMLEIVRKAMKKI